jgi:hypothetical protein
MEVFVVVDIDQFFLTCQLFDLPVQTPARQKPT